MGTITEIEAHKKKLADRAQYAKDVIRFGKICEAYLGEQNEAAWQEVISALIESNIANRP